MALVNVKQRNDTDMDIEVPDEWTNKHKERYAKDIAARIKVVIDDFFIEQERVHLRACQVVAGTQRIMVVQQ